MADKRPISPIERFPILVDDFSHGWIVREDASMIPLGAAQESINITLTARKGIAPRLGESLYCQAPNTTHGLTSVFSFQKAYTDDILVFSADDSLYYYSPNAEQTATLKTGYTDNLVFGYKEARVNSDFTDKMYYGNGIEPFSEWSGYDAKLTTALTGGETSVQVDTIFTEDILYSGTATSCTTTTITMPAGTWATNIWNSLYVHITSGAQAGRVSPISATTATQITFTAIAGLAGTPTFEIRQSNQPASGTLVIGGTSVAYSAIYSIDTFTTSAFSGTASIGTPVTTAPIEYPQNPRGNIFDVLYAELYVAGLSTKATTVYRSKTSEPSNFTIGSPRAANEGDIISLPYGGKQINDLCAFEDKIYAFKPNSIEAFNYSQPFAGGQDLLQRDPILNSKNLGSIGRVWRIDNDIMFCTPDKKITTIGRINYRDLRPQLFDIGYQVRRALDRYSYDLVRGAKYQDRIYVAVKSDVANTGNDIMLVYNTYYRAWEGYWTIPANNILSHNDGFFYADSYNPNIYQMFTGINKTDGTETFPMDCSWMSGWMNTNKNGFYQNNASSIAVEGYITANTTINVDIFQNFNYKPATSMQILGTEEIYQDGKQVFKVLGISPIGLTPIGAALSGDRDSDGKRHFIIFLNFSQINADYFAVKFSSSGLSQSWEIIRFALNSSNTQFMNQSLIKN